MVTESHPSTKSGAGPTDAALVVAARAGEAWAQEALFVRHAGRLLGLAQRMLGASDEADDLVQDSFVRALSRLSSLDNPQAFAAWLTSIAVHGAQKRLRRRRLLIRLGLRTAEPLDPDLMISPVAPAEVVSELRAVYSALIRLSAQERLTLLLRRVEGLDLAEIAQTMHISLATVKRRLVSAEKHLKLMMNNSER